MKSISYYLTLFAVVAVGMAVSEQTVSQLFSNGFETITASLWGEFSWDQADWN